MTCSGITSLHSDEATVRRYRLCTEAFPLGYTRTLCDRCVQRLREMGMDWQPDELLLGEDTRVGERRGGFFSRLLHFDYDGPERRTYEDELNAWRERRA